MFQKILDNQNPFWQFMSKMFDLAILNILWLLLSLPVFTVGATTTGLFAACFEMIRDQGAGPLKTFWKSMKINFRQATGLWLVCLAVSGLLIFDLWYFTAAQNDLPQAAATAFVWISALLLIVTLMTFIMAFALLSLFDNTVKQTLSNALILVLRHPLRAIPTLVVNAGIVFLSIYSLLHFPMLSVALTLFCAGIAVFFNALLLFPLFQSSLPEDTLCEEESEDTEV